MSKKKKRDPPEKWESRSEHERFVRIFESMYESPAFISLPTAAVRLYLILKNEFRGDHTGNRIICPYDTIVKHGISRNTIRPNLRILEALGFIVIEEGTLMREASIYHFSDKWKDISAFSISTGVPISLTALGTFAALKGNPFSIAEIAGGLAIGAICSYADFYRAKKNRDPSYSSYLIGIDELCRNVTRQSYTRLEEFIND